MPYDSPLRKPFCGDKAACPADAPRISFGCDVADRELNGGLRADGLHEFYARSRQDIVATISFALLIGQLCQRRDGRTLIWAREVQAARNGGNPYGPGLAALGIDTRKLVLLILPDAKAVLRAALDAARDAAVAAVVVELTGRQPQLDLTATRRFALAAAEKDTMVLSVRLAASPTPSAAHSRWQIAAAPSRALNQHVPGAPAFEVELLRQRGGRDGISFIMEWDGDSASFRLGNSAATAPPLSRPRSAMAVGGAGDMRRASAA